MVIKLYISGISGNKEVKKKQQRVQMILDSKQINYEAIDITEPGKEKDKEFMQQNGKVRENLGKYPLPPQIFNDDDFCGDYEDFDLANEVDELEKFLHIEPISKDIENDTKQSEDLEKKFEQSSTSLSYNPYEYHTFKIKCVNGLKEQIVNDNNLTGESEQKEEIIKSEVNGETEAVPVKSENIEVSEDVPLEKEESSNQENVTISKENEDTEVEKVAEDNAEEGGETEEKEKEEEEKVVDEKSNEENLESQNPDMSSPPQEEGVDDEGDKDKSEEEEEKEEVKEEEEEGNESEKEEDESEKASEE